MTLEARHERRPNGWFDPRVTISGMIQIILLMFALFKFSSDMDRRTSLLEQTVRLHSEMLRDLAASLKSVSDSNQKVVTIIEQYQSGSHFVR